MEFISENHHFEMGKEILVPEMFSCIGIIGKHQNLGISASIEVHPKLSRSWESERERKRSRKSQRVSV